MTSAELKHRVKLQEWAARIQDCRSSGLSVRAWCRQEEINASTYYRWERELLTGVRKNGAPPSTAVTFAELPAPKQVSRNVAERSATLHIGNAIFSRLLSWYHISIYFVPDCVKPISTNINTKDQSYSP